MVVAFAVIGWVGRLGRWWKQRRFRDFGWTRCADPPAWPSSESHTGLFPLENDACRHGEAFSTTTGKLPNTSTWLWAPKPPSMNTKPAGPKVGLPPWLSPVKVMSLLWLPPWIAMSYAKVAVSALETFTVIVSGPEPPSTRR